MEFADGLVEARFIERLNRFAALVEVGGRRVPAHVPNSGRLRELLYPGAIVLVAPRAAPRKTSCDLLLARQGTVLVSIDARLPGALLAEALQQGRLPELGPFNSLRREVPLGKSRLDLLGEGPDGRSYLECKSVTLVREGVALFPDAPTARGVRHLDELGRAARAGHGAVIVFVIQRADALALRPYAENDPELAAALKRVAGPVRVLAYRCSVTRHTIALAGSVPVWL